VKVNYGEVTARVEETYDIRFSMDASTGRLLIDLRNDERPGVIGTFGFAIAKLCVRSIEKS
jgi:hypothetical protein